MITIKHQKTYQLVLILLFSTIVVDLGAQVNISVRIDSGSSTTTCDDGLFGGAPDPQFRVNVAGQGWTTYQQSGICFTNTPNTQYNESFDCSYPSTIQVCLRAFEDDGAICIVSESCLVQTCFNYAVPAPIPSGANVSTAYTLSVGGNSTATINFTITTSGNLLNQGNDFICNATPLGALPFGGSLGNENSFIYNNICATGSANGDVNPPSFNNQWGVWFSFTTGSTVGTELTLEIASDGIIGDILIESAIFASSNNACNGVLTEVANSDDPLDLSNDETITLQCPEPNTTYYILVDGESNVLDFLNLFDEEHGYFGVGIYDDGVVQAADFICDAEYLGTPSPGSPVTTTYATQSNICGTEYISPTTFDPLPGASWSTDPADQQGVWFQFTAPPSGSVFIDIESTADILNIFQPNDLSVQVALYGTDNNTCSGTLEFVDEQESDLLPCGYISVPINDLHDEDFKVRCLVPGENYWIFVDGDPAITLLGDGVEGYFNLTVSDLSQPPAPNDDICNATFLGAPLPGSPITLLNQSNLCASNFVEVNNFGWSNEFGVWYSFIAPPSGAVEIWAENQFLYTCVPAVIPIPVYEDAIQIELAVFGSASGVTCTGDPVANQNDENVELVLAENEEINDVIDGGINLLDAFNDEYIFVECLIPGDTYFILVDGYPNVLGTLNTDLNQGIFDITIEAVNQTAPTGNDLPCDAVALGDPTGGSVGGGTTYNNYCATVIGEPDVLGFDTTQTVWFTFVAPSTGSVNVDVNENGDDIDLQIAVFVAETDCTGNMVEIASNDDFFTWDVEIDEIHCLDPGETYYLMVDGEPDLLGLLGWEEGEFTVQINEIPTLPNLSLNNFICDAVDMGDPFTPGLGTTLTEVDENNLCANNLNDPTPAAFDPDYTVWYEFTTPAAMGTYAVEVFVESEYWTITDPFNFNFDAIDPQVAVYAADPNDCTGVLTELGSSYTFDINIFDAPEEELLVECLEPNTTYYIMVDGATTFVGDIGFGQGNFDISITSVATNPAAPNNDICEFIDLGTVPVGGTIPPTANYYNFCADTELGEPAPFGIDQTVWFTFNAPNTVGANASSNVTLNLYSDPDNIGDEINLQVAVYESDSDCTGNLTLIDDEFDGFLYDEDLSVTCLVPGQQYFIQVDGADNLIGGVEGYFTIEIIDDGGGQFPTNDDICATAYPLGTVPNGGTLTPPTTFSNLCATIEPNEPDPGFGLGLDDIDQTVWFTFTPPSSGNVFIDANSLGSDNVDLQLAAYYSADGTCDPAQMVPIDFQWDGAGLLWDEDLLVTCLDPSVTYYLQVDGSSITEDLQSGNFSLSLSDDGGSTTVPYNNDICDAYDFGTINISEGLTNETNECADVEIGEPGIFGYAQHTVWYEFVAPTSGRIDIVVDPDNIFNLLPEIYLFGSSTGDCTGTLTEIDSDIIPNINIDAVISTTCIVPGETYFIQVDGQLLAPEGLFDITLTDPEPNYGTGLAGDVEPPNNDCANAIPVALQDESCFIGDGIFQTENYGEPTISLYDAYVQSCNGNGNCGDTWYCFTMPPSGAALIEGNDDNGLFNNNDLTMIAYQGDCNGLIPLDCEANDEVSFEVAAPAGTKIYLQIFDGALDYPNENFEICISEQCGADNCLNAIVMEPNVPYCWDTSNAGGENLSSGAPGYGECATGSGGNPSPEHSVFFTFLSDCNGGSITLDIFDVIYDENNPNYQPCDGLFGTPSDGFTVTIFADETPCDNNFDDQLWCLPVNGCSEPIGPDNYSVTFNNLLENTNYIIMIDGGVFNTFGGETGGNVEGFIMITTLTNPDIDSMVVVDSIACFGETGTVTAEVSGGLYPYTYNWDNVSTDSIYTNVGPGWHYVSVSAANGCEEVDSIFLPEPPELFSSATFDPASVCYGQSVTASASASGGTPAYSYEWSNGEMVDVPTLLEPGNTYTVTITDDNGCTSTEEIVVPPVAIDFVR